MPAAYEFSVEQIKRLRGPESQQQLADAFGISTMPIRRWRKKHGYVVQAPVPPPPIASEAELDGDGPSEEEILRDEVKRLKSQIRRSDKATIGDERVLRAIELAAAAVEPVYLPVAHDLRADRPAGRMAATTGDAHHRHAALWSDWHYGETVSREQMNGLNEFGISIAEERVDQLVSSMLAFKRVSPALTGLDIWALGDMASGSIHALEETNEVPAAEQYVAVGYLMADAIRRLAPHYADISCAGIVGNHPRPGKEPASKDSYNNGDWIAYQMAKALTRDLDNVTWEIPRSGMVVRKFGGKTFLLWHGDGVRSSMPGVPWGGIARRVNELFATYAARGVYIDYVVVGHFHQRCIVPKVYMNSSLVGPNEYGLKNFGGGEAPKQLLLEFDERRARETAIKTISFEPVSS